MRGFQRLEDKALVNTNFGPEEDCTKQDQHHQKKKDQNK